MDWMNEKKEKEKGIEEVEKAYDYSLNSPTGMTKLN